VIHPVLVTEQHRPVAHYVLDQESGRDPLALCGLRFRAACLTAPVGELCPACAAAAPDPGAAARRRARRRSRPPAQPAMISWVAMTSAINPPTTPTY
jgi:hypothetical protein